MQIVVSQPFRQHTHHLCHALQQQGWLTRFYTSFWYKPQRLPYSVLPLLPASLAQPLIDRLRMRCPASVDPELVRQLPHRELVRQLQRYVGLNGEGPLFRAERAFDRRVARELGLQQEGSVQPDVVIAYEKSALTTFTAAKGIGGRCVLDIASVHYAAIAALRQQFSSFDEVLPPPRLFAEINKVKEAEYQESDHIIVLSTFAKKTFLDAGVPEAKLSKLTLGFDPNLFQAKTEYSDDKNLRLLFVGTALKRKGIETLLHAMENCETEQISLTVIGPSGDGVPLLEQSKLSVRYLPTIAHEELSTFYREADLVVLPSYLESWGMVVPEAMACGTPCIVTETTGSADLLAQGGGAIIPAGDVEALAGKLSYYLENKDILAADGRAARQIAERYTWEQYYQGVVALMKRIAM